MPPLGGHIMLDARRRFATLALRAKLLVVNLAVVATALVTMVAIVAIGEWHHARSMLVDDTHTQAQMLGEAASAAVVFGDRKGAEELLDTLRLSPHIREGALFAADGAELAAYVQPGQPPAWPRAPLAGDAGQRIADSFLDVSRSIRQGDQVVGYILLRADLAVVGARLRWALLACGLAAALALAAAVILSRRLREVVAGPVARLADVTREITMRGDYSRRAQVEGRDEVATLAGDFNSMIEQIERRNQALIGELEQRREAEAKLDHLAHFDALTGLPNRRHFQNRIEAAIALSSQFGASFSLMFIDLDNFKYVNDSLGHQAGDELLRRVARTLHGTLRASDIIFRLGGDEFAVIVEGMAEERALASLATKLIDALAQPVELGPHSLRVGCSVGIARCPADCRGTEELLRAADAAMYHAKASGKNTFRLFHPQLQAHTERRLWLESALRGDLAHGRSLFLQYQPVWSVQAERIVAAEALCRWRHGDAGLISPTEFIPVAEDSGLILRLGSWVLSSACAQAAEWRRGGYPLQVAVNVSGRQLRDGHFFDDVADVLAATGLPPDLLEIEITESVLMDGLSDLAKLLARLREIGVRIALDDFGTGYSSLNYLKRLPIDKLKIDKSFVGDLPGDADDCSIARAIVALGHSLDLQVQAEGVENEDQLDFLTRLGCEFIQGYHVGTPMLDEELEALVRRPNVGFATHRERKHATILSFPART